MKWIILALVAWNVIIFLIYGLDKLKATQDWCRVSERTLLALAFLMGGAGAFFGMRVFRHCG